MVRRRAERGASAVEFALMVPVLLMLVLGISTSGLTLSRSNALTNAVREGARFGATADASPAVANAWADGTIARVNDTLFDGPVQDATVCVQLWQVGTGEIASTGKCTTFGSGPALTRPTTATQAPAVPANGSGTCVVRVLAARPFTIDIGLTRWSQTMTMSATARYERKDKLSSCA